MVRAAAETGTGTQSCKPHGKLLMTHAAYPVLLWAVVLQDAGGLLQHGTAQVCCLTWATSPYILHMHSDRQKQTQLYLL